MNIWVERIVVFAIGAAFTFGLRFLYDWKIKWWITKSHKKREKEEEKKEETRKKEKQQKIDALNQQWKISRAVLQSMRKPLMGFNTMNRYQSSKPAEQCFQWASQIQEQAVKIEWNAYMEIKNKLLEYAGRIDQTDQNSGLNQLMNLFQRKVNDKYEPLALWQEIEEILKVTSTPPYSEDDI